MFDYEALRALDAVIRHQSFGRAAQELLITQSAVSQRLHQLESNAGSPLLIRELPYCATPLGEKMLSLLRQVSHLEHSFKQELPEPSSTRPLVKIAVNLDSLEFWFSDVLRDKSLAKAVRLAITTDDEKFTLRHLRSGRVDLCVSAEEKPIQNYEAHHLGGMAYFLVATPEFKTKHFPRGLAQADLSEVPAVVYDEKDDLHHRFLKEALEYEERVPVTAVPSVRGFRDAIVAGFGYGVLPRVLIERELRAGALAKLLPGSLVRDLFLHHWNVQSPPLKQVISSIRKAAKELK